jgi:hypothetical protein
MTKLSVVLALSYIFAGTAFAEDCGTYPFGRGQDVIPVEGSDMPKIISTARATPFSEDISDVDDAYDEATLEAKSSISKFMSELVESEELRAEVTEKLSQQDNNNQQKSKTTVELVTKVMSSSSQALLRGVVVLGDCYTPGREVRVTVGLKPETLSQAAGLASATSDSLSSAPTETRMSSSSSGVSSQSGNDKGSNDDNLQRVEGHSNTSRLKDF